jgi:hypothetical protein
MVRDDEPDCVDGRVASWGPVTRGDTEYRFFVRKGIAKRFGWLLQARPDGATSDFTSVAAGAIQVGAVARRGRGALGIDLDALGAVDPTVSARGQVLAAFAHGPAGTTLAYGLRDFTKDPDAAAPIDAVFQDVQLATGASRVRLAFHGNVPESTTSAEELVLARVRHHPGVGGRADLRVTSGDVPAGKICASAPATASAARAASRRRAPATPPRARASCASPSCRPRMRAR